MADPQGFSFDEVKSWVPAAASSEEKPAGFSFDEVRSWGEPSGPPKKEVPDAIQPFVGLNEIAANIAGAPVDAATWLLNKGARGAQVLTGQPRHDIVTDPIGGSGTFKRAMGLVGANPDDVKPPETTTGKILRATGEGVGMSLVPGMAAEALAVRAAKGVESLGSLLNGILRGSGNTALQRTASNTVLGATSGAGEAIARDQIPETGGTIAGSETAANMVRSLAPLAGGIAGGTVGAVAETGARAVPGLVGGAVRSSFENPNVAAARKIMGSTEPRKPGDDYFDRPKDADPVLGMRQQVDEYVKTGPAVPDSEPTMFQLTGDKKLGELERDVRTANPGAYTDVLERQGVARTNAVNTAVDPSADPNAVGAFVRQRLDNIEAEYGGAVAKARQEAESGAGNVGGTQFDNQADYGGGLQKQLDTLNKQKRTAEDRLWEDFREAAGNKPISVDGFKKDVAAIKADIDPLEGPMVAKEAAIFDTILGTSDFSSFKSLGRFRSRITNALRDPQELDGAARGRLSQMLEKLDGTLDTEVGRLAENPEVARALNTLTADDVALYGQARTATRERKETFGSGAVGDVLEPGDRRGTFATTQSLVPGRLLKRPEDLREFVKAAGDSPDAMALAQDALAFDMRRAAVPDGILSPKKLQAWSEKNAEALRQFPDLQAKFANARTAQETLDGAIASQKAALETFQTDAVKKFLADKDSHAALDQAMNTPESFRALVAEVKQDPAALAGLKRLAVELILRKGGVTAEGGTLSGVKEAGTSESPQLAANAVQRFFLNKRSLLADIFDEAELKNIAAVTQDMQRAARTVKIPDQSNTAQDMGGVFRDFLNGGWRKAGGTMLGGTGAGLMTLDPVSAVVGAAVGKGVDSWRSFYQGKVDRAVADMMLHPKVFAEWAPKVKQATPSEATFARRMRALLGQEVIQAIQAMDMEAERSP